MKIRLITMFFLSVFSERMMALSVQKKASLGVAGGCAAGLTAGYAFSKHADEPGMTILTNGFMGCLSGIAFSYFFDFESSENDLAKKNTHLKKQLSDIKRVVYEESSNPSARSKFLDSLVVKENFSGENGLKNILNPTCTLHKFTLGEVQSEANPIYLPVTNDIIIKSFEYYVAIPGKDSSKEQTCVKSMAPFHYLDDEFSGLGNALFVKAREHLKNTKDRS